ncbi:TPA: hypothetical protein ENG04_11945 [Candidatus Poribacteria bacterium]|nr:hypothetical protein [Candidatus Poribacteria bacterium]HEX30780.1 hypothetical protein [Candidatus Poribacteria bacterium]
MEMDLDYLVLPRKLSEKLKEKADETGILVEELGIDLILKGLNEKLDPEELAENYRMLSEKYLEEADEFIEKGDYVQASEKLWGAAALAVKMAAAGRGLRLEKHGGLWHFIDTLAKELEDRELISLFHVANGLHRNFYENEMPPDAVRISAEEVKKLIAKLKEI